MPTKIGVISDTHGLLRPEVCAALSVCDMIIHGGDINKPEIIEELERIAPLYVVRGNNDKEWAKHLPASLTFTIEDCKFFLIHGQLRQAALRSGDYFCHYGCGWKGYQRRKDYYFA